MRVSCYFIESNQSKTPMKKKANIHIGCSGWNYNHWKGLFYPEKSSSKTWFSEYSSVFSTVEINNTFYQLPGVSTFKRWHEQADPGFIYAVKANRFITHMKKLTVSSSQVNKFLDRSKLLKKNLGPILFQLPPRWSVNIERLDKFTDMLPGRLKYVFEFRNSSWYNESIYKILSRKGMSMCLHDMKGSASPMMNVGPICYIRFHGTTGLYGGKYHTATLRRWANFIKKAIKGNREAYAYFNNDAEANAPKDALRLIKEIKK